MTLTQAKREISIKTPLGDNALLLRSFHGSESLSNLFSFELELISENASIAYDKIVSQNVTISVNLADGKKRFWNGWISRFAQLHQDRNASAYRATMVPWLWFLSQTTDCRIFQNKTVPDLLKQIFQEYGYSDFSFRLVGSFAPRDYCVQYRESDFNFVSRLMEEEGIFYFFEQQDGKHTLILGNDASAVKACPGQAKARYESTIGGWQDDDAVLEWAQVQEVGPGVFSTTDYNFETPTTSLLSSAKGKAKWEMYDYPGEFSKRADGDRVARARLEELQMPQLVARGKSNCRAFGSGFKFSLTDHYRKDLNQEYVITALHHSSEHAVNFTSGQESDTTPTYTNTFECVPALTPIRPARQTPIPVVQGCHTAVVVGPGGEEIYTDKYGRVKVQFHWDREGKNNENSSCWVRVSYPTAGKAWGAIQIPRIGQEVIVDFIEGDPDQPIITGRTYNAGQMPPWDLPGKRMVSGFKSNSTKGGGGFNEISFDDTKGTELIQVHGQFDMDTLIENDERRHVKKNRTKNVDVDETTTIGSNRTEKVGSNETITVGSNRTEKVGAAESITIGASRTELVGASETVTVKATRTHNVIINDMLNVGAAQEINIGGAQALTIIGGRAKTIGIAEMVKIGGMQSVSVGAAQSISVTGPQTQKIGATQSIDVGASQTVTIGAGQTISVKGDLGESVDGSLTQSVKGDRGASVKGNDSINTDKNFVLEAKDKIEFKTGDSSIVMDSKGVVTITCKTLTIKASDKGHVEVSGGNLVLKGSEIQCN
jgi:type VI secretion system secreted protein VgrG